jgi:hypothetical protein
MRCMRCACEVTLGWMEVVSSRVNPRTGETVTRLLCERCAGEGEGRTPTPTPTVVNRDTGANLELVARDLTTALTRARRDGGMTL